MSAVVVLGRRRGSHALHLRLVAIDRDAVPIVQLEIVTRAFTPWRADLELEGAVALAKAIMDLVAQADPRRGRR